MNELALFAGIGGGILGGQLLGWRTRCAVELDPFARDILLARQADEHLLRFPIWDDVRTFDGRPWRGAIDVISGGFPCQDISSAGAGKGLAGGRSGLWFEMLRIVGEVRPRLVFIENSPHLRTRGLGTVLEGLASLGYDARWGVLGAWHLGAPHKRDRMWILSHADNGGEQFQPKHAKAAEPSEAFGVARGEWECSHAHGENGRVEPGRRRGAGGEIPPTTRLDNPWRVPLYSGVDDGLARKMDIARVTGNAQVPIVAAAVFEILNEGLK